MTEISKTVELKRRLGLHHGVAVLCGLIIGSGIYVSPKGVIAYTGSPGAALVIWAVTGVLGTLGALSFAELGTTYPSTGEKYVYLEKMFGPFAGFLYLWMYLLIFRPGANAIKCIVFGQYLLQPFYDGCAPPPVAVSLFGICLAALITYINCIDVRASARGQALFTSFSVSSLIIITVIGIVHMSKGEYGDLTKGFEGTNSDPTDIVLAIYSGIFAFWGWNALNFMVEELKNPYRNLPIAIGISMFLVTVLYLLVNVAYLVVLGTEGMMESSAVAVSFGQKALGGAAWVMPLLITFSSIGSYNSGLLVGSRLSFAGARAGHLPDCLALIGYKSFSPVTSLILQLILVSAYILIGDIRSILNNLVAANTLADTITMAGMIYLRWKQPDLPRPLKMPIIIPSLFLLCMLFLFVCPLINQPKVVGLGLLFVICSATPLYLIGYKWKEKPKAVMEKYGSFTRFLQKVLNCAMPEH